MELTIVAREIAIRAHVIQTPVAYPPMVNVGLFLREIRHALVLNLESAAQPLDIAETQQTTVE